MRGTEAIIAARLAGIPVAAVVIDRIAEPPVIRWPELEIEGGDVVGKIEVYDADTIASLDLRCCHGLRVSIFAGSYAEGWPLLERVLDCEPASMIFATPEMAARFDGEELHTWEM